MRLTFSNGCWWRVGGCWPNSRLDRDTRTPFHTSTVLVWNADLHSTHPSPRPLHDSGVEHCTSSPPYAKPTAFPTPVAIAIGTIFGAPTKVSSQQYAKAAEQGRTFLAFPRFAAHTDEISVLRGTRSTARTPHSTRPGLTSRPACLAPSKYPANCGRRCALPSSHIPKKR